MATLHLLTTLAASTVEARDSWPKGISRSMMRATNDLGMALKARDDQAGSRKTFPDDEVYRAFIQFMVTTCWTYSRFPAAKPVPVPTYRELLERSQLVMMFAHLDAFLADSVRAACRARPQVMHGERHVAWSEVLAVGSWPSLVSRMTEAYAFELGMLPLKARIAAMRKRHLKLSIDVPPRVLHQLDAAENARNAIVHDGGRVSLRYLERSAHADGLRLGDPVAFPSVDLTALNARWLAGCVFRDVSAKFLGKKSLGAFPSFTPGKEPDSSTVRVPLMLGSLRSFLKRMLAVASK